jgi:hypothetical protein
MDMNERIKQLLAQAHLDADNIKDTNWIANRFAELIVRECIGCCEQVISDPVPKSVDTWLNGGEQCIQEIKEHFGLGMSVETKKQLIKELLGVNNDSISP